MLAVHRNGFQAFDGSLHQGADVAGFFDQGDLTRFQPF